MGDLWTYLILVLVGFLPNEMWRVLGLVLARGLNENSEIVTLSRAVTVAILAGIIVKLILFPSGNLANIPLGVRLASAGLGFAVFVVVRRSVFASVVAGEVVLLLGGYCFAH
jgi:hypothetical protein